MGTFKDSLNLNINQGELLTQTSILKEQFGSVILGTVVFENNQPVNGAAVILSYINSDTNALVPFSFMFTDMNGQFIFTIKNTSWNYVLNIVYNEEI